MDPELRRYNMNHSKRGTAVIICNSVKQTGSRRKKMKHGTEADLKNLTIMFERLGFNVAVHENLKSHEMTTVMHKVAKDDHSNSDCFACAIVSNGEEKGAICAIDKPVFLEDLLEPLRGDSCPTLAGKPKLFFIDATRGKKMDSGVEFKDSNTQFDAAEYVAEDESPHKIPSDADFFLAFSTVEGHVSFSNTAAGSWFIQTLSEIMMRFGGEEEITKLMTRVNHEVAFECESSGKGEYSGMKQMPCMMSMLTKQLYFTPK